MKIQLVYWVKLNGTKEKKYMECEKADLQEILGSIENLIDFDFEEIPLVHEGEK